MTPLIPQLVKAAAIVVGAGIVLHRLSWREFPAFVAWMLWEVMLQGASLGYGNVPVVMLLGEDVLCAAAICEVIRESRLRVELDTQIRVFIGVIASAKILASLPALTEIQAWYLFRSYFLWAAFIALLAITIVRWRYPILERKVTKVLRAGMTAWIFEMAVAGSFVPGGLGYKVLPYTMHTWRTVHVASCLTVGVVVIVMSAAMALSVPGRKRASVWAGKGKVVTGKIEQMAA